MWMRLSAETKSESILAKADVSGRFRRSGRDVGGKVI
jgi:hypothetical protein